MPEQHDDHCIITVDGLDGRIVLKRDDMLMLWFPEAPIPGLFTVIWLGEHDRELYALAAIETLAQRYPECRL